MSGSLDKACEAFVAALEQAQQDLNHIRRTLEDEFKEQYPEGTATPLQLAERVHALERGIQQAVERNAELQKKKNDYVSTMNALLQHNASMAKQLHSHSACLKKKTGTIGGLAERENIQANTVSKDNRNRSVKNRVRSIHSSSKDSPASRRDEKNAASGDDVYLAQVQDIMSRLQEHGLKS